MEILHSKKGVGDNSQLLQTLDTKTWEGLYKFKTLWADSPEWKQKPYSKPYSKLPLSVYLNLLNIHFIENGPQTSWVYSMTVKIQQ